MTEQNSTTNGTALDSLHKQINQLKEQYGKYIEEESIRSDIDSLSDWIEAYLANKPDAAEYLQEHGVKAMESIRDRLKMAVEEMHRIEEESPNAKNFSGGKVDRLHTALKITGHAEESLQKALEEEMA